MTRSSRDTKGISFDTVEWLGAGIGAKSARFTTGSHAPIEKQN
ncbi:hypothetical protein [Rhizobium sp. FKY42]|nr:hypothetical protein [Rhizobium sp. FKY42]